MRFLEAPLREPISPLRAIEVVDDLRLDRDSIADSLSTPASFGVIFDRHFDAIHGYLQRQVGSDLHNGTERLDNQMFSPAQLLSLSSSGD